MIVKLLWLSLYLDFYFNPEFYGNLGRTEIENKRCCEMPRVLAHGFWCWHWDGEAVAPISAATWAHVCVVHMLPLSSETGEGALASHEEAFLSLSNVNFPSGDLWSTKWQCPQVMHYSAATWGPQMCCGFSSQDVLCPGDIVPGFFVLFSFVLMHLARKGRSQRTNLTWTWGIIFKYNDPSISHSVFRSWEEQRFSPLYVH